MAQPQGLLYVYVACFLYKHHALFKKEQPDTNPPYILITGWVVSRYIQHCRQKIQALFLLAKTNRLAKKPSHAPWTISVDPPAPKREKARGIDRLESSQLASSSDGTTTASFTWSLGSRSGKIWPWGITYGSILGWMNIHLPAILMSTRGTGF